jgi:hypothetical protein
MAGKNGGARPGAGRPKGSKTVPQFRNYVSEKERRKFVEFVLDQYMGDIRLALWFGEQLFGKAPQHLTGDVDAPIQVNITPQLKKVYGDGSA